MQLFLTTIGERTTDIAEWQGKKLGFDVVKLDEISEERPETSAWRLPDVVDLTYTDMTLVGSRGFYQRDQDIYRHIQHRIDRKQLYDEEFIKRMAKL